MIKKIIFFFLLLGIVSCTNKKKDNVIQFINSEYSECNVPIIRDTLGTTPVCFIIDTGANISIIDSSYYRSHTDLFTYSNTVKIAYHGIGGSTEYREVDVVIGDLSIGKVVFTESDLSAVKNTLKIPVAGVIGSDFLRMKPTIIDYNNRAVYFTCLNLDSLDIL